MLSSIRCSFCQFIFVNFSGYPRFLECLMHELFAFCFHRWIWWKTWVVRCLKLKSLLSPSVLFHPINGFPHHSYFLQPTWTRMDGEPKEPILKSQHKNRPSYCWIRQSGCEMQPNCSFITATNWCISQSSLMTSTYECVLLNFEAVFVTTRGTIWTCNGKRDQQKTSPDVINLDLVQFQSRVSCFSLFSWFSSVNHN